jgi:hypothetical protein
MFSSSSSCHFYPSFIFPSITCCRRQFLRKMWPILTCIIFALYPAADYHARFVKSLSFLRLLLCHSLLSYFVPLYLVSVLLPFSSSFCHYFFIVCQYLVTAYHLSHAELNWSVSPYPHSLHTDATRIALGHWDIEMENSMYHSLWKWKIKYGE